MFEKVDSKEYNKEEIKIKDDMNLPFIEDKEVIGFWTAVDIINIEDREGYKPNKTNTELFIKNITINPNGEFIFETKDKRLLKDNWTKGKIINTKDVTVSDYIIKEINGEKYLILDWKSGDYSYQGDVNCCYVFKKF